VPFRSDAREASQIRLGLIENWQQFSLLMLVNAFVGAMAGMERVVLPLIAQDDFGLASRAAILSFIVSFGLVKALANLFAGRASDRIGRKRVLLYGWLLGIPVPFLIYFAPAWGWVILANVFLGLNQGFCWSATVVMKIDLVGPQRRGLAMGLNEATGYLAVAGAALCSGFVAASYGLRIAPLLIGTTCLAAGIGVTLLFVRDTLSHVRREAADSATAVLSFREVFHLTSWKNPSLFSISQAGMVNNLNDGMAWGLFPLYFSSQGLTLKEISVLGALYPAVWGLSQLGTGALSDRLGRKGLIAGGMILQGAAIFLLILTSGFLYWVSASVLLGLGTALVYPALLAAIGDVAHPSWRASAVGVYRLWRDSGYAVGAVIAGTVADAMGIVPAIGTVAALTLVSGVVVLIEMKETLPKDEARTPDLVPRAHNGKYEPLR
jgi:MFS family permease